MAIVGGCIVATAFLFWGLLALAFAIPSSALKTHASQSQVILEDEGILWMQNAAHTGGAHYDNYTTYHMLNIAVQSTDNPIVAALKSAEYKGDDPNDGLIHAIAGEGNVSYQRYWHGYVVFLRPALVFFDIKQIRLICQIVFFVLLAALVARSTSKLSSQGGVIGVLLVASYMLFGAAQATETLPITFSFIVSVIASLAVIRLFSKDRPSLEDEVFSRNFVLFLMFGAFGAVTVFFDFLDNPILTFCIPACYGALCLRSRVYRSSFSALFAMGAGWCVGYFALWICKWVLTDLVIGDGAIESALMQAYYLSGGIERPGVEGGPIQAILANVRPLGFLKPLFMLAAVVAVLCVVFTSLKSRKRQRIGLGPMLAILLVISFVPYLWYAVFSDHSIMHAGLMTYRNQIGSLFPWLAIILLSVVECRNRTPLLPMDERGS